MDGIFNNFMANVSIYVVHFSRFLLPLIAFLLIFRCINSMMRSSYESEIWGYLDSENGARYPLRNWEIMIGRAKSCDVQVDNPDISKTQAVLIRDEKGRWTAYDVGTQAVSSINDEIIYEEGLMLADGDTLNIHENEMKFYNLTEQEREIISKNRSAPKGMKGFSMFLFLSIFQLILVMQNLNYCEDRYKTPIFLGFFALFILMWLYYFFMLGLQRKGLEVELIAFFLSTIGLSVCASSTPENMFKQVILTIAGVVLFMILGWWLRDLKRVKALRGVAAVAAVLLLAVNIVLGTAYFGATNWISIGGFSIQPSEFVKILYIYAGASTLDRLYRSRNLIVFIVFSAICVGALALMGDFGTALVFFITFLVISFMRSGSIGTIFLALSGAGLAGFLAITVKPHIAARFSTWGHVWEDVYGAGYQQAHAMSAAASGGLFGGGAGSGWLKNIIAADTDLVFEVVCEELGILIAFLCVVCILLLAVFVIKNATQGRSTFYVIAGSSACAMLMSQMALNVFGSLDILPFTGVTFPFVSLGGSSLISCWLMMAFIKACDTRKNASFVVKAPTKLRDDNEFSNEEFYQEEINDYSDPFKEYKGNNSYRRGNEYEED